MKKTSLGLPKAFIGIWRPSADAYSTVQFTVRAAASGPTIRAVDTHDGESLRVSGVQWDGNVLRFQVFTPSTNWTVDHEWRTTGGSSVKIRYTLTETWTKVRATSPLQRTVASPALRARSRARR
jgi:hypothetical protein